MRTLIWTAIIVALSTAAFAQNVCGKRDAIVAQLEGRYGEARRSVGLQSGMAVEVYASEKTGSWTILRTDTTGKSCLIAVGNAYQAFTPEPAGEKL